MSLIGRLSGVFSKPAFSEVEIWRASCHEVAAPRCDELRRVIAIGETRVQGSRSLTLLSLELYEDGFILGFQLRDRAPYTWQPNAEDIPMHSINDMLVDSFTIEDETGARYLNHIVQRDGDAELVRGGLSGTSAIAETVTHLRVTMDDSLVIGPLTFEIDLT